MKYTKAQVKFESPARGKDRCGACIHYIRGGSCDIVAGKIKPGDWCNKFRRKKAKSVSWA
jgi:hypothetical protein